MDTQIRRRLDELVRAIRSSEEYRIFEEAKRSLNEEPDKRKAADAFRRRNFAFQNSEESMSSQAQVDMYHEREKLRRDPLIRARPHGIRGSGSGCHGGPAVLRRR